MEIIEIDGDEENASIRVMAGDFEERCRHEAAGNQMPATFVSGYLVAGARNGLAAGTPHEAKRLIILGGSNGGHDRD